MPLKLQSCAPSLTVDMHQAGSAVCLSLPIFCSEVYLNKKGARPAEADGEFGVGRHQALH
jgi:hypothetical protein